MKFKVGDQVIITSGKDKGKKSKISKVLPRLDKVIVEDVNLFTRHVKKSGTQAGQKTTVARAISPANIAILNENGIADRIGYQFDKDGNKQRIFKKTKSIIGDPIKTKKDEKKN